jgi:hypothetical protein
MLAILPLRRHYAIQAVTPFNVQRTVSDFPSRANELKWLHLSLTFDWSDIPISGDHDSYSSPPRPTSVQHVNTCPPRVRAILSDGTDETLHHTSYQTRVLLGRANSSLPPLQISATQSTRSTSQTRRECHFLVFWNRTLSG